MHLRAAHRLRDREAEPPSRVTYVMAGVVYESHASAVMLSVLVGLIDEIVPTKAIPVAAAAAAVVIFQSGEFFWKVVGWSSLNPRGRGGQAGLRVTAGRVAGLW